MKKFLLLFFYSIFLLTPIFANASTATPYFQFAPDVSNPVLFSNLTAPVVEIFKPNNEFMSGFDIWLANEGTSDYLTITLKNQSGTVLINKDVLIPNTPRSFGGTKFHISLGGQIPVSFDKNYYIEFTSMLPELYLYKADRVQLLEHNSEMISEPLVGFAQINSINQAYTFKYALYEIAESSSPVLINPSSTATTSEEVTVTFRANEPIDYSIVENSANRTIDVINFSDQYQICVPVVKACSVTFTKPLNTNSGYSLIVKDIWENQAIYVITGEGYVPPNPITPPNNGTTDTTPPKITNLRVVSTTLTSASFAWTTDEPSTARVLVKQQDQLVGFSEDKTFELEHFITVNGLTPYTNYAATVVSNDPSSNSSYYTLTFATNNSSVLPPPVLVEIPPSNPPVTPPLIPTPPANTNTPPQSNNNPTNPSVLNVSLVNSNNVSAPDGYRVDVLSKDWKLVNKSIVPSSESNVAIKNLPAGDYNVIVYANDKGVFKKTSEPQVLTVAEPSSPTDPNMTLLITSGVGTTLVGVSALIYIRKRAAKLAAKIIRT